MSDSRLTLRQVQRLDELVTELRDHGVEIRGVDDLHIKYLDESRPGRGHDISVLYLDGDHAAGVYIDVYGNGASPTISTVDFICNPGTDAWCQDCVDASMGLAGVPE